MSLIPSPSANSNREVLLFSYTGNNKDVESRLRRYTDWLDTERLHWWQPDLAEYRDYLLDEGLAPVSVAAHLSTLRGQYQRIIRNRDVFYALFPPIDVSLNTTEQAVLLTARSTGVNEIIARLINAIHESAAPVEVITEQDIPDSRFVRLSKAQARRLLLAPGMDTIKGIRDTTIIATMLCTGIREEELTRLEVGDEDQTLSEYPALWVRRGKGAKARLIPYGQQDWARQLIRYWLDAIEIEQGPIFRAVRKNGVIGDDKLTTRAVQYILKSYPIPIHGTLTEVTPHDLRRTYARRQFEAGMDLTAIQQNLGHSSLDTTLRYIGALDVSMRLGRQAYNIDLDDLVPRIGE